ncbi:MAG TPA: hypothetical protein VIL35_09445 [Vicinamibacterales bacterium]
MADIDVVHKRSRAWVWWVLAVVVLAIVLWMMMRPDRTMSAPGPISLAAPAAPVAVLDAA